MRTPVSAIHDDAAVFQALGKVVVMMVALVLVSQRRRDDDRHDHDNNDGSAIEERLRWLRLVLLMAFSSLLRHAGLLYHDVQRRWQDLETLTLQRKYLAIDHHVHRAV